MENVFGVLAFIKTNIDTGKNIWDSLFPLIGKVIIEKGIYEIDVENLCDYFRCYYGFSIPMHPMITLINKAKFNGYLNTRDSKCIPNIEKIKGVIPKNSFDNLNFYSEIVKELDSFIQEHFPNEIDLPDSEKLLISYLNRYDSEILSTLNSISVISTIEFSEKEYYIVNRFIEKIITDESLINRFVDLIMANIYVNSIFYSSDSKRKHIGKINIYLDTRVIFRLIGLEKIFRENQYKDLLEILKDNSSVFKIFEAHYKEILFNLDECIYWIQNRDKYNSRNASRILRSFIENNYSLSDVLEFKLKLENLIKDYNICIEDFDYSNTDEHKYNIDEIGLFNKIVEAYKEGNPYYDKQKNETMIWNDVKAISAIYRKRRGEKPECLKNVSHIFITTNNTLARISRILSEKNSHSYQFQECVTDVFFGTAVWLNYTKHDSNFIRKKIIADCMAQLQINEELKEKYINKLIELKERNNVSEEMFTFLRSHEIPLRILSDLTYNDGDLFTDKLPEEILEQVKLKLIKPYEQENEKQAIELLKKENTIETLIKEIDNRNKRRSENIEKKSKWLAKGITFLLSIIILLPTILVKFVFKENIKYWYIFEWISIGITFILLYSGLNMKIITLWLYNLFKKRYKEKYSKEQS